MRMARGAEMRQVGAGASSGLQHLRLIAALAAAGIAGPVVFTVLVIVQGLLQPDYSHVALPISALAAWPSGWIQNVNFVVLGLLMTAYAVGLQLGVRPRRGGVIGPVLLVLSGTGLVLAGLFPWRGANPPIVPVGHMIAAFLGFLGAGSGLIVVSRRMARDPKWRNVAAYALATGIAIVVLFVVNGFLVRPDDAPLHAWAGVVQRVTVLVWFSCTIVLALRLLRVARAQGAAGLSQPGESSERRATTLSNPGS